MTAEKSRKNNSPVSRESDRIDRIMRRRQKAVKESPKSRNDDDFISSTKKKRLKINDFY